MIVEQVVELEEKDREELRSIVEWTDFIKRLR